MRGLRRNRGGVMARKLGTWPAGSPEWHEARRGRIGGSEIGTVYGLNPYEDAASLAARKRGDSDPRPDTPATIRGCYLEPAVAEWLEDTECIDYDRTFEATWVHDHHDWALFNPDRVTTDGRLVEIKTAAVKDPERGWGRAGTDQIPLAYQAQVQWGMGILGLKESLIGVCFGQPFEFRRYRMRFDRRVFNALVVAGQRFINDLESRRA